MVSNQVKQSTNQSEVQAQIEGFKKFNRQNLVHLTRHLHRQITLNMNKRLEACGYCDISVRHFSVFDHLDFEGTNIVTLAQRANMTKQAMGKLVKEANISGYVATNTDQMDSRSIIVSFTDKGLHFVRNVQKETSKEREIIIKNAYLSQDDVIKTMSTLSKISDYFDNVLVAQELILEET